METELENFKLVEQLFGRSLTQTPHISLWSSYINYIRRINNLSDPTGQARSIIIQVYDFVLENMGIDINSGRIWLDYIELLKNGPGVLGGGNWQDMQKMDSMRKAYQRAIAVPTNATLEIWREYDKFEMGLNKVTVSLRLTFLVNDWKLMYAVGPEASPGKVCVLRDRTRRCHCSRRQYHQEYQSYDPAETPSGSRF